RAGEGGGGGAATGQTGPRYGEGRILRAGGLRGFLMQALEPHPAGDRSVRLDPFAGFFRRGRRGLDGRRRRRWLGRLGVGGRARRFVLGRRETRWHVVVFALLVRGDLFGRLAHQNRRHLDLGVGARGVCRHGRGRRTRVWRG